MTDITLSNAASVSHQLNSLLVVLSQYGADVSALDRENLTELALELANRLALMLTETEKSAEVIHVEDF